MHDIILASKSKVRNDILSTNGIHCRVVPSNVDEDSVKISLTRNKASPEIISKNLAELKANKVSSKFPNKLVMKHFMLIMFTKSKVLAKLCFPKLKETMIQ